MNNTPVDGLDQSAPLRGSLVSLVENTIFLREWYRRYAATIRVMDRTAAYQAHDSFLHAAVAARTIARAIGHEPTVFTDSDFVPKTRPKGDPLLDDVG